MALITALWRDMTQLTAHQKLRAPHCNPTLMEQLRDLIDTQQHEQETHKRHRAPHLQQRDHQKSNLGRYDDGNMWHSSVITTTSMDLNTFFAVPLV
ncbi:hypothetical protein EYF80_062190 [Liparis tanakae]|uniref:Uncharacterized protein n=1 Tax=Liparis tanakae TaxID=230148 RepID=A0A4Z2EGR0_9TELE|nr:hypothetical protein EYF80_062190 [Liparis tanakae]